MCDICLQNPCDSRCPNNDEEPVYVCEQCDNEIYEGQTCYNIADMIFCEECVEEMRIEA